MHTGGDMGPRRRGRGNKAEDEYRPCVIAHEVDSAKDKSEDKGRSFDKRKRDDRDRRNDTPTSNHSKRQRHNNNNNDKRQDNPRTSWGNANEENYTPKGSRLTVTKDTAGTHLTFSKKDDTSDRKQGTSTPPSGNRDTDVEKGINRRRDWKDRKRRGNRERERDREWEREREAENRSGNDRRDKLENKVERDRELDRGGRDWRNNREKGSDSCELQAKISVNEGEVKDKNVDSKDEVKVNEDTKVKVVEHQPASLRSEATLPPSAPEAETPEAAAPTPAPQPSPAPEAKLHDSSSSDASSIPPNDTLEFEDELSDEPSAERNTPTPPTEPAQEEAKPEQPQFDVGLQKKIRDDILQGLTSLLLKHKYLEEEPTQEEHAGPFSSFGEIAKGQLQDDRVPEGETLWSPANYLGLEWSFNMLVDGCYLGEFGCKIDNPPPLMAVTLPSYTTGSCVLQHTGLMKNLRHVVEKEAACMVEACGDVARKMHDVCIVFSRVIICSLDAETRLLLIPEGGERQAFKAHVMSRSDLMYVPSARPKPTLFLTFEGLIAKFVYNDKVLPKVAWPNHLESCVVKRSTLVANAASYFLLKLRGEYQDEQAYMTRYAIRFLTNIQKRYSVVLLTTAPETYVAECFRALASHWSPDNWSMQGVLVVSKADSLAYLSKHKVAPSFGLDLDAHCCPEHKEWSVIIEGIDADSWPYSQQSFILEGKRLDKKHPEPRLGTCAAKLERIANALKDKTGASIRDVRTDLHI
eukprot:TRINITY_DN8098_c0_g1_i1.p1 TRINITY_DN8098_c0_g1~~TRINITY_DN8098_c0_g1_i1.p1  ORF type:complete len:750 (+),score=174.10 TRINITY_DN8098_c0_g1_i1:1596-3845(+)